MSNLKDTSYVVKFTDHKTLPVAAPPLTAYGCVRSMDQS